MVGNGTAGSFRAADADTGKTVINPGTRGVSEPVPQPEVCGATAGLWGLQKKFQVRLRIEERRYPRSFMRQNMHAETMVAGYN